MDNPTPIDEHIIINLYYSYTSSLGILDGSRYHTDYKIDIEIVDDFNNPVEKIGKVDLKIVLLSLAMNNGFDMSQIFDNDEETFQIGQKVFDFEEGDLKSDINESLNFPFNNSDIGIIREIEILPAYRGKGLGQRVMKDIISRLQNSCGLLLVQPYPFQFAVDNKLKDEWSKKMRYKMLDQDFEKSDYKLKAFFQSLGFVYLEDYPEFMFLALGLVNEKLDAIELD